uniref:B30.2/SPRY domain-containing protein n=1 Tax=Amphilophus citrinellus TaxID=61819 RepID=A0A3Q0RCJ6_AMPCI
MWTGWVNGSLVFFQRSLRFSQKKKTVLKKTLNEEFEELFEAELMRVQQYAVDVTLDPDTANPALILSDDGKQVHCGDEEKNLPDNPERFSEGVCVLGNQSFSSGRFYFEVQVKEKTKWILGVTRESVNRKEVITVNPENGYWTVALHKNINVAFDDPPVRLSLQFHPEKVGVFVDYEEGLVSFYDVGDAALIYSFTEFISLTTSVFTSKRFYSIQELLRCFLLVCRTVLVLFCRPARRNPSV